ncbi:MAG: hypothetical protein ACTS7I_01735 [Candidatus Hodgkinia cicadicola]
MLGNWWSEEIVNEPLIATELLLRGMAPLEDLSRRQLVGKETFISKWRTKVSKRVVRRSRRRQSAETERSSQLRLIMRRWRGKMIRSDRLRGTTPVTEESFGFEVKSMEREGQNDIMD